MQRDGVELVQGRGGHDVGGSGNLEVSGASPGSNIRLLVSDTTKHHACEDGLGEVGEDVKMGRVGSQGGGNVLQGGGTGGTTFWIGDLGTFGGNV